MTDKGSRETFAERLVRSKIMIRIYRPNPNSRKRCKKTRIILHLGTDWLRSDQVPDTVKVYSATHSMLEKHSKTKPKQMQKNVSFLVPRKANGSKGFQASCIYIHGPWV